MNKIGVDIGGTKINVGLFDDVGTLIANEKQNVKDISDIYKYIRDTVLNLASENQIPFSKIETCGIGIPGTVSCDGRRVIKAPNISLLDENFADRLEGIIGIRVGLVQDSRAAAWGEYLYGAGRGKKSVVCVTLGTGIGTGIVIDNTIYNGSLGCAGEIGHIPVVNGGRKCGCGRCGCLEKYCSGGGLDITAEEILGKGKKARDLFSEAEEGNSEAAAAINNAIEILGKAMVSVINIMSPDCLLFSGGLSAQTELYINPVIEYIKRHCYSIDTLPDIRVSELGENAPLFGAAYLPIASKKSPKLSASIMCADVLNIGKALKEIESAGIDYVHCDIMDNHFVPNMMMPAEILNKLRTGSNIPFDFHIMADNPESIIEKLDIQKNDIVSVHYESTVHLERAISRIKEKGAKASAAINPATPIEMLSEILPELDMVLIMTVNPGFSGQKLVQGGFDKIMRTRKMLGQKGYNNIIIEVDGNCSFENVPKMYKAGADMFVVGTSSVFKKGQTIEEGTKKLHELLYRGISI